jgi:2-oxoglutarate dehydrogenase E1 component
MAQSSFQVILDETDAIKPEAVKRVIICSGKVYYDLRDERRDRGLTDVAIIRLEQLYPFPHEYFETTILQYKNAKSFVWCQEEPMNQGAWYSSQHHIHRELEKHFPEIKLEYAGRDASAAAAAGYPALHLSQQHKFINEALT